jgi:hypothetical protein
MTKMSVDFIYQDMVRECSMFTKLLEDPDSELFNSKKANNGWRFVTTQTQDRAPLFFDQQ